MAPSNPAFSCDCSGWRRLGVSSQLSAGRQGGQITTSAVPCWQLPAPKGRVGLPCWCISVCQGARSPWMDTNSAKWCSVLECTSAPLAEGLKRRKLAGTAVCSSKGGTSANPGKQICSLVKWRLLEAWEHHQVRQTSGIGWQTSSNTTRRHFSTSCNSKQVR